MRTEAREAGKAWLRAIASCVHVSCRPLSTPERMPALVCWGWMDKWNIKQWELTNKDVSGRSRLHHHAYNINSPNHLPYNSVRRAFCVSPQHANTPPESTPPPPTLVLPGQPAGWAQSRVPGVPGSPATQCFLQTEAIVGGGGTIVGGPGSPSSMLRRWVVPQAQQ